jgi:hypothetical protein
MNSFVLAAGIAGNAQLHGKLAGPEAGRAIDCCLKKILRVIEVGGGNVLQTGGGEVVAAFGAADAVVNAAIEMQQRVADLPPVSGVKMAIRVGVSCKVTAGQLAEDGLVREAAHLAGIAKAGQILAAGRICQSLPAALQARSTDTGSTLLGEPGSKTAIVEIGSGAASVQSLRYTPDIVLSTGGGLRLRYGKAVIVLDGKKPVIDMGRDGACDVVIRDPRASRRHATIKCCENRVVLIDKSSNGSFVTIGDDSEQFVKHAEIALHGKGVIAFAASSAEPDADCARFECTWNPEES